MDCISSAWAAFSPLVLEAAKRRQQVGPEERYQPAIVRIEIVIVLIPEPTRLRRVEQFAQRQGILEKESVLTKRGSFAASRRGATGAVPASTPSIRHCG